MLRVGITDVLGIANITDIVDVADIAAEVLVELAAGGLGCRSQIWPVVPVV